MRKAVLEQPFEKAGSSEGVRRGWETRRQKGQYNKRAQEVRDVANASLTWGDDAHDYYKKLRDGGKSHEEALGQMNAVGEKRARSRIGREPLRPLAEFEHSTQQTYLHKSEERKESWQVGGQHPHTAHRRKNLPQVVKDAMKWQKNKDAGVTPKAKKIPEPFEGKTEVQKRKLKNYEAFESWKNPNVLLAQIPKAHDPIKDIESLKRQIQDEGLKTDDDVIEYLNRYNESFGLPDNNPVADGVWNWWKEKNLPKPKIRARGEKQKTLGDVVIGTASAIHPRFVKPVRGFFDPAKGHKKSKVEEEFDKIREWQEEKK